MKLIICARFWNDIEWIDAALEHLDYWNADFVGIGEGAWDPAWPARSTDGTRELLEEWSRSRPNVHLFDNPRDDPNYRTNQSVTSNYVMEKAEAAPGDWMFTFDVDHFYFKSDIDAVKELISTEGHRFDYLTQDNYNFLLDISSCQIVRDRSGSKLPYKILPGSHWIPTCHLAIDGILYSKLEHLKEEVAVAKGMHYEGIRSADRMDIKYRVGDRKSFREYKDGIRLKGIEPFSGPHPDFVLPTLKRMGYAVAG